MPEIQQMYPARAQRAFAREENIEVTEASLSDTRLSRTEKQKPKKPQPSSSSIIQVPRQKTKANQPSNRSGSEGAKASQVYSLDKSGDPSPPYENATHNERDPI